MAGDALDALQITVVTPTAEWRPQFLPAGSYGDSATIERSAVDRQCALMRSIIGGSLSDFYRARKWQHLLASLPRWCLPLIRKHLMWPVRGGEWLTAKRTRYSRPSVLAILGRANLNPA